MTPFWTLRTAEPSDAAAIAELIRLAFATQSRATNPPPSALKETADTVRTHLGDGGGAVVDDGGVIAGAVLWNEEEGGLYIGRLSVHPDHRRRGIASALMHEAEREARRRGLSRLWLGVRLVLDDNRRFFAAQGFRETTLHHHEGFTEPTWVTMERELPSPSREERAGCGGAPLTAGHAAAHDERPGALRAGSDSKPPERRRCRSPR